MGDERDRPDIGRRLDGAPPWRGLRCGWIGGARHARPLDASAEKRWRALATLGIRMSVIGFSEDRVPRVFTQHACFYLLPRLGAPVLRYLTMFLVAPWIALWLVFFRDVRVLIAQSPYEASIAALVKRVAGWLGRRIVLVVESHGDFEEAVFLYHRAWWFRLYRGPMRVAARYALRHADLLRAISASTRRQLSTHAAGRAVEQFAAWTDADAFLGATRETPPSGCRDVVYAGLLAPVKGVHVLVDAFARVAGQVPQARLWIAGPDADAAYVEGLHRQVRGEGLGDRVVFRGELSQAELACLLVRARALVLPSFSEGLGRVLVEAMLCGTPVIGSRVGGIPELIRDGENGYLVPAGDAGALAGTLGRVLAEPGIDAMGRRAREFARAACAPDAFVAGHRRLLERACALLTAR